MHIDPTDEDVLVMGYNGGYWTGADWFHHPECSLDMNLEDAVEVAIHTNGASLLVASMMIDIEHGAGREEGAIWIDYPDSISVCHRGANAVFNAILHWLQKCTPPPTSLYEFYHTEHPAGFNG